MFKTTIGPATDWLEPTARNSNLFPVKANGLVRLRSPGSRGNVGKTELPILSSPPAFAVLAPPFSIWSTMSWSMSPRKTEMIAGGASLAPRRWSLWAVGDRDPQQVAVTKHGADHRDQEGQELSVLMRRLAGLQQVVTGSSAIDQLRCLPDPFTPANGFSCSKS